MKKKKALQFIYDALLLLIGSAISAYVMDLFLVPNQIAPGGASGLSLVINFLTNNLISTGALIIIINIPLFLISFKVFGKAFAVKSVIGTVIYSAMVDLFRDSAMTMGEVWFGFSTNAGNIDLLLFSIYGGVLLGVGFGLVIRGGASTGGSGLGAQLMNRVLPSVSTGVWLLILDAFVIISAAFAFKNIVYSLYSIIVIWISSTIMDLVVEGVNHSKAAYIISDKSEEIKHELLFNLKRGVTTLVGRGAYSDSEKNVLLCVVQHAQVHELKRIVARVDDRAFVILNDAKEVLGEGFRR